MGTMKRFILLASAAISFLSCSKEYDRDRYVGDYSYVTSGYVNAFELIWSDVTNDYTAASTEPRTFYLEESRGEIKIFKESEVPINRLSILFNNSDGSSMLLEGLVDEANTLETGICTQHITLLDENRETVVYEGPARVDGEGSIYDGVLRINLTITEPIKVEDKTYGYISSHIAVIAEKM